jgi:hypothetical protein
MVFLVFDCDAVPGKKAAQPVGFLVKPSRPELALMTDRKTYSFRPPLYHDSSPRKNRGCGDKSTDPEPSAEQRGWDAYRKWLSRVGARPARERSPIDHSLYSWKGYNSWADKIKETWKSEDTET